MIFYFSHFIFVLFFFFIVLVFLFLFFLSGLFRFEVRFEWLIRGEERARSMSMILPPFHLPSSSARALWSRWYSKQLEQMNKFHQALLRTAQNSGGLTVHFHNCDDAASNDLFFAAVHSSEPDAWIRDRGYCGNHNTQHSVQWLVTTVFTMAFISTLFKTTTFLAMGTHLYRIVLYVPTFVQQPDRVVFKAGVPSLEETTFAATLQDSLCVEIISFDMSHSGVALVGFVFFRSCLFSLHST